MLLYLTKLIGSALLILIATELSKRSTILASLLISLPIISVISLSWIYIEQQNKEQITQMSYEIFWLVLPSLIFFLFLPYALNSLKLGFWWSLSASLGVMVAGYFIMLWLTSTFMHSKVTMNP